MSDWHVLNYHNISHSSGRVVQSQSAKSKCYDSYAHCILAGSRGQSGGCPIKINGLKSLGVSSVNAVVEEIPFNKAGTVTLTKPVPLPRPIKSATVQFQSIAMVE